MSLAARKGYPLAMLGDANGGRLPDLLGNAYGEPALWAGSSDFVVMVADCSIALSGPSLVGSSTGAASTHEELGGPAVSVNSTGLVTRLEPTEAAAIAAARRFLAYLPSHAGLCAPLAEPADPATPGERPYEIVPDRGRRGYDIRGVIDAVADAGSFCEQRPAFARSAVVGLARVQGTPVAMIANQPKFRGGVLDADAVAEITRIADLADGFGLPLVFLQDMPGVMIGLETSPTAESAGAVRPPPRAGSPAPRHPR